MAVGICLCEKSREIFPILLWPMEAHIGMAPYFRPLRLTGHETTKKVGIAKQLIGLLLSIEWLPMLGSTKFWGIQINY